MEQARNLHEVRRGYLFPTSHISNAFFDSTLGPDCVADAQQAAVYYFTSTVNLFKNLPTYDWLTAGGIAPSSTKTYTREDIVNALQASSAYGFEVGLECNSTALYQVNYYFNVSVGLHTICSVNPSNF